MTYSAIRAEPPARCNEFGCRRFILLNREAATESLRGDVVRG